MSLTFKEVAIKVVINVKGGGLTSEQEEVMPPQATIHAVGGGELNF